jgi:hypothetical protein
MLAGCSAAPAGKAEFAEACQAHMGGQKTKCECYVASVEQTLTPELFASVAQGAYDNRRMNGMVPQSLMAQPVVNEALLTATKSCFA